MSEERRFVLALGAAIGAALLMVLIAIGLNRPAIAEFSIAPAIAAVLTVRLATRR